MMVILLMMASRVVHQQQQGRHQDLLVRVYDLPQEAFALMAKKKESDE